MSITQLKEAIHEGVENLDDETTLALIQDLIARQYSPQQTIALTAEQQIALSKSREDYTSGKTLDREFAAAAVSEWLNRKK